MVFINILWARNTYGLPTGEVLATLPEGYRPIRAIYRIPCCIRNTGSGTTAIAFATINADGSLLIEHMTGVDVSVIYNSICLSTSFFIAE